MNFATSSFTIGHQNRTSIMNEVLCSWMYPDSGDMWHADINTCLNLMGTTLNLSCLTLALQSVS